MFTDADIISRYTRAEAIEDGELIDVTETAREAGFTVPVALTRAAWVDCVAWGEDEKARKNTGQDEAGRLWDVLYMGYRAASAAGSEQRREYDIYRTPSEGRGVKARRTTLAIHIGPGDDPAPVITIMLPHED